MKLLIHTLTGARIINSDDIIFLKADGNYTIFHMNYEAKTDNKANFTSIKNLKENELLLPAISFYRCHRSYIINFLYFFEYVSASDKIVLEDSTQIKISRNKKEEVKTKLLKFMEYDNKRQYHS